MDGKTILNLDAVVFEMIYCYKCHIPFAVTKQHRRKLLDTHDTFYCPNGHSQYYVVKTESEKLREELIEKDNLLNNCHNRNEFFQDRIKILYDEQKELKKKNRLLKSSNTKLKKKISSEVN